MAEEEIKYTIPNNQAGNAGSQVDVTLTYDETKTNADGSYTVTDASGTYKTLDSDGNVVNTDNITGIAPPGTYGNDNELFLNGGNYVNFNGIGYTIDSTTDSNDGTGTVDLYYDDGTNGTGNPVGYYENGNNNTPASSITADAVCFVSGTRIRTARGEVAVEELVVGDVVVTAGGAHRPIRWLGHRDVACADEPGSSPVCIRAGAFGAGLPARELRLSPGHPVLVGSGANEHLVPIMCLVNGTSVRRVGVERVTYWHVELDAHDILLAEGLPAESYIDLGSRPWFAGADGVLYDPDLTLPGQPGRCRPVAVDGPVVEMERRRLAGVFATSLASDCAWPAADAPMGAFRG